MTHPRSVVVSCLLPLVSCLLSRVSCLVLFVSACIRQEDGGVSKLDAAQQGGLRRKNGVQCAWLAQSLPYVILTLQTAAFVLAGCLLYPCIVLFAVELCEWVFPPKKQITKDPYFREPFQGVRKREGHADTKTDLFLFFICTEPPPVRLLFFISVLTL